MPVFRRTTPLPACYRKTPADQATAVDKSVWMTAGRAENQGFYQWPGVGFVTVGDASSIDPLSRMLATAKHSPTRRA
jgi:hypothetical protein